MLGCVCAGFVAPRWVICCCQLARQIGLSERSRAVLSAGRLLKQSFDVLKVCVRVGSMALLVSPCIRSRVWQHRATPCGTPKSICQPGTPALQHGISLFFFDGASSPAGMQNLDVGFVFVTSALPNLSSSTLSPLQHHYSVQGGFQHPLGCFFRKRMCIDART